MFKCSEYKEKEGYVKGVTLLFKKVLKKYSTSEDSFLQVFSSEFSKRSYTGKRFIYSVDREFFRRYCTSCASTLDYFFTYYSVSHLGDRYEYRSRIKGSIGCRVDEKELNIQFSYKNASETHKDLDFFGINNYIYNQAKGIKNDCLVMSVNEGCFYLIKYDQKDYTMKRGLLAVITKNGLKRRGEHCLNCQNRCKPLFINGLDRLRSLK